MLSVFALDNLLETNPGDGPDVRALELLSERETARAASDWAAADRIRDELLELGWAVRDGSAGPELIQAQ